MFPWANPLSDYPHFCWHPMNRKPQPQPGGRWAVAPTCWSHTLPDEGVWPGFGDANWGPLCILLFLIPGDCFVESFGHVSWDPLFWESKVKTCDIHRLYWTPTPSLLTVFLLRIFLRPALAMELTLQLPPFLGPTWQVTPCVDEAYLHFCHRIIGNLDLNGVELQAFVVGQWFSHLRL